MDKCTKETMTPDMSTYETNLNISYLLFNQTNITNLQSANRTNSSAPSPKSKEGVDYFHTIIIVLLIMILIIGSVGNSVVCYVFGFKQRKRRSVPETLFLYLGTVDLVASIVNPSLYIYWTVTEFKRWDFGIVGCKILAPLAPISVTLSALLILIIAVDRYIIIVHQFGRNYSSSRVKVVALVALIVSVCLFIPYILYLKVGSDYPCLVVEINDLGFAYPTTIVLLLQDVGFISILVFTNTRIRCNLRHQKLSKFERAFEARRHRSNTRLTRILIAMSCVFCLLVIPRDILQLIFIISWLNPPGVTYTPTLIQINTLCKVFQTANSCVNVFIYSKMHRKFRVHLMRLICGLVWKKHLAASAFQSSEQPIPKWKMRLIKLRENDETPTDSPRLGERRSALLISKNGAASKFNGSPPPNRCNHLRSRGREAPDALLRTSLIEGDRQPNVQELICGKL